MSIIWKDGKPYDTLWDMYVEDFGDYKDEEQKIKDNRAFVLDSEKVDDFLSQSKTGGKKAMDRFMAHQPKEGVTTPFKPCKIKNGSKLTIGESVSTVNLKVDQHFNWFQKLMWKWCFGIKVEDYNEE